MTGKRPKSVEYVTEHLCGRSVVSTGECCTSEKQILRGAVHVKHLRAVGHVPPLDLLGADKPISGSLVLLLIRTLLRAKARSLLAAELCTGPS